MKQLVVILVVFLVQNTFGLNSDLVKVQYNDGINEIRESMNQQIPKVADELFNGFGRFDESLNGLKSNCNEIVTEIFKSNEVDSLHFFNYDLDVEVTSVLDVFQPFYDHKATKELVGKYFTQSFQDIDSELRKKLDELNKYIDENDKTNQCYLDVENKSISKMFVVFKQEMINIADVISKSIQDQSINFQNSVTVTISTMKSDLEACLSKGPATVSCFDDYVNESKVFGDIDNYRSNIVGILMKLLFELNVQTEMLKAKIVMLLKTSIDNCVYKSLN
ncbi:unnamed protein product [Diamesa serratosioi]